MIQMNKKIDWGFWLILISILVILLIGTLSSGCALIKPAVDFITGTASNPVPLPPDAALYSKVNWLSIASIIGIAIAAAATVNGQVKLAMPIFAGCVAALGISLAVVKYASFLAIGSLIAAVCIFVYSVLIKNRAVKELVTGAEELKKNPTGGSKVLFDTQTPSTRGMVNRIKDALRLKGKL
jgi:hypothetical protein